MMSDQSRSEALVRRRARASTVFGILFIVTQAISLPGDPRSADGWQVAAFVGWGAILLLVLATGGGLSANAAVRRLINDEGTRANRLKALATGFWACVAAAFTLYVIDLFRTIDAGDALRLVVTVAVAAALLSFGARERRALRDA